jgi:hypothetical protein
MNLLIVSVVRSGSSRLLESISTFYKQEGIFEPTTPQYKKDFNPKKDIVKIAIQTKSVDAHIELINQFDNVILLDRKDILAQAESYLNLWEVLGGNYNSKYVSVKFSQEKIDKTIDKFKKWKSDLKEISEKINQPIIYLEDLLEFKDIGDIGYDKAFFKPEHKLRQSKKRKTRI